MAELWDLYDENGNLTDETMERGGYLPEGRYRQVVHCCIFNQQQQLLCQKRAFDKIGFPGYWDVTVGGCVVSGEDVCQAMSRELKEELGLCFNFTLDYRFFVLKAPGTFDNYFFLKANVDLSQICMQQEEVEDVAYYDFDQIEEMIENDQFIPYEFMSLLIQCRDILFNNPVQPTN